MVRVLSNALLLLAVVGSCWSAPGALAQSSDLPSLLRDIRQLYQMGRYQEALPLAQQYAGDVQSLFGAQDPKTLAAKRNVAELFSSKADAAELVGQTDEAVGSRRAAIAILEQTFGPQSLDVAKGEADLAATWLHAYNVPVSDLDNTNVIAQAISQDIDKLLADMHVDASGRTAPRDARDLYRQTMEPAEQALRRAINIRKRLSSPSDPELKVIRNQLAGLLLEEGRGDEAQPYFDIPPAPHLGSSRNLGEVYEPDFQSLIYFGTSRPSEPAMPGACGHAPGAGSSFGYAIFDMNLTASGSGGGGEGGGLLLKPDARVLPTVEIRALHSDDFLAELRGRLQQSQRFPQQAIVFVHGFNVTCENAFRRAAQLQHDLGFDGAMLVYTWPSKGELSQAAYLADQRSSLNSADDLRAFLQLVVKSGAKTVHLIAHSMGNPLLISALERLQADPSWVDLHIGEVILAAPDMDTADFVGAIPQLRNAVAGITLYASASDKALLASQFVNGRPLPRAGYIDTGAPLVVQGVETVDISAASSDLFSLNHSTYAESPALIDDIKGILHGVHPPDRRSASMHAVGGKTLWQYLPPR